jgi:coenzyme F420 hydrogenase subunit beta
MEEVYMNGPLELENEVLKQQLCSACGACMGLCGYFGTYQGRVVMMDSCSLSQGRCYAFCPRTLTDMNKLRADNFDPADYQPEIGPFRGLYMARATDKKIRAKSQHGGCTTALAKFAMEEGLIDSAVLTRSEGGLNPQGVLVTRPKDVERCAGSSFQIAPSLAVLNKALKENKHKKIGVVGTPCKTLAVYKMKSKSFAENGNNVDNIGLVIGLFCGWGLDWQGLENVVKNATSEDVKHIDILPSKYQTMEVKTGKDQVGVPLKNVFPIVRKSCNYCADLTAEFSDLAIGGARSTKGWDFDSGWNQIIVRTRKGEELLKLAKDKNLLEFWSIGPENFEKLKKASMSKKATAIKNIVNKTGTDKNLLYLDKEDTALKTILQCSI